MATQKEIKFKHFSNTNPGTLCEEIQTWVNGQTESVDWVAEFHVVVKGITFHAFVKYIEN